MLHELTITDLGVIEAARIEFGPGLTCVTGETGAGKTMVLTGLGLILGAKGAPSTVRSGADEAVAEAVVDVPLGGDVKARLDDAGVQVESDGTVIVSRTVGATTRSRTIVGGRTVPQALLADIAGELVTVHGQSDQIRLRSAARQRDTLDVFGGESVAQVRAHYRGAWQAWRDARDALTAMEDGAASVRAEVSRLRDDLAAIDAVAPEVGEDERLEAEISVLDNAEAVRIGAAAAHQAIAGDEEFTVVAVLESARRALADAARHDPRLAGYDQRLADFLYGASDIATDLSSYLDSLDADPARLDHLHRRRSDLAGLMRRLGVSNLAEVHAYAEQARPRVAMDDDWDATLAARHEAEELARSERDEAARQLTSARREAANLLAAHIDRELELLAMPDASVTIEVTPTEPAAHGADVVAFSLAAHPGAPARPIAEAASGGELSRIMLAIEVALATVSDGAARTFVFDEVDAGVGGRAATAVGNRLARLALTHQVIVVTHLAQVAAFADTHVVVAKTVDGPVTRAQVGAVTAQARVEEIARLLSGQGESSTARAHALELLEASHVAR